MSKPFDATLKDLVEQFPGDYEAQFRLGTLGPLHALNVDLSTISAATDSVLAHGDPPEAIVDINFQAGRDDDGPARFLLYSALLHYKYRVPVHSIVVLLRPSANDARWDEGVRFAVWPARGSVSFSMEVIRLWEQPVEAILDGGLGTLPLAPLCKMPEGVALQQAMPDMVRRIRDRLNEKATPEVAGKLWSAMFVLSGLRLTKEEALSHFQGVYGMRESTTYQYILEEGQIEARKKTQETLIRLGRKRFGPAPVTVEAGIRSVDDFDRLERMTENILDANGWDELLKIS